MTAAMLASGGFTGLAGAVEVLGTQYRYIDNALTAPGYAWASWRHCSPDRICSGRRRGASRQIKVSTK
jgi:hypothetical protein